MITLRLLALLEDTVSIVTVFDGRHLSLTYRSSLSSALEVFL